MNKGDLIESVASRMDESKAQAARAVEAVLESISSGVQEDGKVTIVGFGSFEKKHRPARKGINPATKEPMEIKASNTVGFKPAQSLKDSLTTAAAV